MSDVPPDEPFPRNWSTGVDVDLDVALALSRAAVESLIALSPQAAEQVRERLRRAAVELESRKTSRGAAAGAMLRRFCDDGG